MEPDNFQQAWQAQSSQCRLMINADVLLKEVQRNQRQFSAIIFWRDVREVGVALVLAPIWIYLGIRLSLPWAWHLSVPAMLWIAGFMLVDRRRHRLRVPETEQTLRESVASSLAQVEHQIWLLRNVLWWYLLPLTAAMLAIGGHLAWEMRLGGWAALLAVALLMTQVVVVLVFVYRLNQSAVRSELEPRRKELEELLVGLRDEAAGRDSIA